MLRNPLRRISCSTLRRADRSVIAVSGEVTGRTQGSLHEAVLGEQLRGAREVIVDLTNVRYFDSTGVTGVIGVQRLGTMADCRVEVYGLDEAAARLLDLPEVVDA